MRAKGESGGLVCYIKSNLADKIREVEWDFEDGIILNFCKVFFKWETDLFIIFPYMKPSTSTRSDISTGLDCFDIVLDKVVELSSLGSVMIAGDMNARTGEREECALNDDKKHESHICFDITDRERGFGISDFAKCDMSVFRKNKDSVVNDHGCKLLRLCQTCDLAILNGRAGGDREEGAFTYFCQRGQSTIDYVICDKPSLQLISDFNVLDRNPYSDHCALSFSIKCCSTSLVNKRISNNLKNVFLKWKPAAKDIYLSNLQCTENTTILNDIRETLTDNTDPTVLNSCVEKLNNVLLKSGKDHIKTTSNKGSPNEVKQKGKEWYDLECKQKRQIFTTLNQTYKMVTSSENRKLMCQARTAYRAVCRRKRKDYNYRNAKTLAFLSRHNPSAFWAKVRPRKNNIIGNCDFFTHFKKLANKESVLGENATNDMNEWERDGRNLQVNNEILDGEITLDELENAIKKLSVNKSHGLDNILNEFLKNATIETKLTILSIFNNAMELQYLPPCWTVGQITPIFKSADRNNPDNYRGVTVLSCLGKLFTRIVNYRLSEWAEQENIISEVQYGFRPKRSTVDCIFILHSIIEMLLSQKQSLYCAFIDYEKCFDSINRAALWYKISQQGVSTKLLNIFKNMYSDMKLKVKNAFKNNTSPAKESEYFITQLGVLQGECTSSILFSLFVNDIENSINDIDAGIDLSGYVIKLLMFADDMVLFSKSTDGLQHALNNLTTYCNNWGLTINQKKTKIVHFGKGGKKPKEKFTLEGEEIESVSFFKYLGFTFSASGSFSQGIQTLTESSRRALFTLKSYFQQNNELTPDLQIQLFNSMISPILYYGCEVWGFCAADAMEKFHMSFLKNILGVRRSTPNCFVYGELGVYPLLIERQIHIIKYWLKLLRVNSNTCVAKRIYLILFEIDQTRPLNTTWVSLLREFLFKYGFGYAWINQAVADEKKFIRELKTRLYDCHKQEWHNKINSTTDNRLYKFIKEEYKFEDYLKNTRKAFRVALTKIRLSSHSFFIERGRWGQKRLDRKDRLCEECMSVEDEYHVLVECPRFTQIREKFLPKKLRVRPSMHSFILLFQTKKDSELIELAKMSFHVLKEYTKYL